MKKLLWLIVIAVVAGIIWFVRDIIRFEVADTPTEVELGPTDVAVIAHRGASGNFPENTIAAIHAGVEAGADMVEIDVHLSKDGKAIIIHDATLERTTSGSGRVDEMTFAELRLLDAGSWFDGQFSAERLPTLDQALEAVKGKAVLLIELKNGDNALYEGLVAETLAAIERHQAQDWVIVQSFDQPYLLEAYALNPNLQYHQLVENELKPSEVVQGVPRFAKQDPNEVFAAINPYYRALTADKVAQLHTGGYKTFTYTVNEEKDMRQLISYGVDGIITNYPKRLVALKERLNNSE